MAEFDGANAMLRRYVHGPGTDEPLVWYEGPGTTNRRFLAADERGSVVAVSDAAGVSLGINAYDAYGIPQTGNLGRFSYTGQTALPEIGLMYYKARMYSPGLGRFMQTDPIGYGDGLNWYNYVGSDPVNFVDPSGLEIVVNGDHCGVLGGCRTISDPGEIARFLDALNAWAIQGMDTSNEFEIVATAPRPPQSGKETFAACALRAAKKNAGTLALDAVSVGASFVPGGKGLVTAGAAVVGSATGVAGIGIGIANRDATGALIGATGHYTSLAAGILDGTKGLAENLPVIGQVVAIGGLAYDSYNALSEGGCLGSGR